LRLPESTEAGDDVVAVDRLRIGSASGPELPMQVVQP
jgi:hypothetical protein